MLSQPEVDFQGGQLRASVCDWQDGVNERYEDVPLVQSFFSFCLFVLFVFF